MKTFRVACAVAVACSGSIITTSAAAAEKEMRFRGTYSGVEKAGERVIEDAETWEKVWKQVHATVSPKPKLPAVDFEKQVVLAVFQGQQSTGGHSIRIVSVKEAGDVTRVTVERRSPGPGAITTQALTQPYDMLVVDKPAQPVKFVVQPGGKGGRIRKPGLVPPRFRRVPLDGTPAPIEG